MWVCVIIYSLCLSSQCVGVVSGWEAGHPYSALELPYYTARIVYQAYFITPLWGVSAVTGTTKSYAIFVNHHFVAALDNIVRISGCFQLQISRLQSNPQRDTLKLCDDSAAFHTEGYSKYCATPEVGNCSADAQESPWETKVMICAKSHHLAWDGTSTITAAYVEFHVASQHALTASTLSRKPWFAFVAGYELWAHDSNTTSLLIIFHQHQLQKLMMSLQPNSSRSNDTISEICSCSAVPFIFSRGQQTGESKIWDQNVKGCAHTSSNKIWIEGAGESSAHLWISHLPHALHQGTRINIFTDIHRSASK